MNKIIDQNMIIPRAEIPFYIQQAIEAGQFDLAQKLLDSAREWYSKSRMLDELQQNLDSKRVF